MSQGKTKNIPSKWFLTFLMILQNWSQVAAVCTRYLARPCILNFRWFIFQTLSLIVEFSLTFPSPFSNHQYFHSVERSFVLEWNMLWHYFRYPPSILLQVHSALPNLKSLHSSTESEERTRGGQKLGNYYFPSSLLSNGFAPSSQIYLGLDSW